MDWKEYYDEIDSTLKIFSMFNGELINLPQDIKRIIFRYDSLFNQNVGHQECDDSLCPRNLSLTLTELIFCREFNKKVDNLPSSLTDLTFGLNFNQSIENLPSNLTHLTLSYYFDQNVDTTGAPKNNLLFSGDNLPPSIKHISLFGVGKRRLIKKIPYGCKIFSNNMQVIL